MANLTEKTRAERLADVQDLVKEGYNQARCQFCHKYDELKNLYIRKLPIGVMDIHHLDPSICVANWKHDSKKIYKIYFGFGHPRSLRNILAPSPNRVLRNLVDACEVAFDRCTLESHLSASLLLPPFGALKVLTDIDKEQIINIANIVKLKLRQDHVFLAVKDPHPSEWPFSNILVADKASELLVRSFFDLEGALKI